MTVAALEGVASGGASTVPDAARPAATPAAPADHQAALREQALAEPTVQAMLDVFAAEIKEVEER
jgi:hypothetical protein